MDNDLDDMLYAAYLAKLESLKGTKKPLVDFIKEIADSSNDFYNLTYKQFQLVTRAIHYCPVTRIMSNSLDNHLQNRLTDLLREFGTEENILNLLEFYKGKITFRPNTMEQFLLMDKLYNLIRTHTTSIQPTFESNSVPLFNRFPYLVYTAIHKHNPDSLLLKKFFRISKVELTSAKKYSKELIELIEYEDYLNNKE